MLLSLISARLGGNVSSIQHFAEAAAVVNSLLSTEVHFGLYGEVVGSNPALRETIGRAVVAINRHHLLHRQFRTWFQRAGLDLDIEKYIIELPEEYHRLIHGKGGREAWNNRWRKFFNTNPNPSRDQILSKLWRLMREFDLPIERVGL